MRQMCAMRYRRFTPRLALEYIGRDLCRTPLGSEEGLLHYDKSAVEDRIQETTAQLASIAKDVPMARCLLNACTNVDFEYHLNSLDEREEIPKTSKSGVDQACIFRNADGQRRLFFIKEYKAPHKLAAEFLRTGLRPLAVQEDVIQRLTIPNEPDEKLKYNAYRLVFLWVPEDDPETVYYYLTESQRDVVDDKHGFRYPFTADWRDAAAAKLSHSHVDFEDILLQIPNIERLDKSSSSEYSSPPYPINPRSPYLLRSRQQPPPDEEPPSSSLSSSQPDDDSPPHGLAMSDTPTPSSCRQGHGGTGEKRKRTPDFSDTGRGPSRNYAYCTMRCMAGIRRREALDPACPNYEQHQRGSSDRHELDIRTFAQRVTEQLDSSRSHYCDPLFITDGRSSSRLQGSRGALFKVTLSSHGYTFMAKGTIVAFVEYLGHEGKIYDYLAPLQGSVVPVHLDNIDLERPYYDIGQKIFHMLQAWGGEDLREPPPGVPPSQLEDEKARSARNLWRLRIHHHDFRPANML
ncbi:hypothetical protein DV736_g5752, partial [Chaetothyriales sp. CBS 134916]